MTISSMFADIKTTVTRRAILAGAGATIATAALTPTCASASRVQASGIMPEEAESITSRIDRLTVELARAMGEYQGGKFKCVVEPGGDVTFIRMNGEARLIAAMNEARAAAEAVDPSIRSWLTKLPSQSGGDLCAVTLTALRA